MINALSFGIPSLDILFGGGLEGQDETKPNSEGSQPTPKRHRKSPHNPGEYGIQLNKDLAPSSVSFIGPDGTGKSVLGLHLASRYVADCLKDSNQKPEGQKALPKVLYVSTDLTHSMAERMWRNFALDRPNTRAIPFEEGGIYGREFVKVQLTPYSPLGIPESKDLSTPREQDSDDLSVYLSQRGDVTNAEVCFVDLASFTAGDDWGFINRVLAILEAPQKKRPPHLMVIDSVEGFETLVGDRDAFGEAQPRRSRIAQVMRSASNKCHIAFIVEESKEQERLPEEFVTDVVIRLRSTRVKDYVRRTIEIKKARGQAHVRGQHPYVIRSGHGSTTGEQKNADDPVWLQNYNEDTDEKNRIKFQSYIHVCHSLHNRSRAIMEERGKGKPSEAPNKHAAFGIPYLDDMLAGDEEKVIRKDGTDGRGLPCSTNTALIGDAGTQKSRLGTAFLSRCFRDYAERFRNILTCFAEREDISPEYLKVARQLKTNSKSTQSYKNFLEKAKLQSSEQHFKDWLASVHPTLNDARGDDLRKSVKKRQKETLDALKNIGKAVKSAKDWKEGLENCTRALKETGAWEGLEDFIEYVGRSTKKLQVKKSVTEARKKAKLLDTFSLLLGKPYYPDDGVPVLLTTQDVHAAGLAKHFLQWLLSDIPDLRRLNEIIPGAASILKCHMEEYSVCRRLEIHDLPAAILIHIVERAVDAARRLLFNQTPPMETQKRFEKSWGIRVVFDDFSIIRHIYTEVYEDPLVLPFIIFYLGREGVTALMIDTQSGRPDTAVTESFGSELRTLVNRCLYTWRFPFFGEDRVAIAAIPPVSTKLPVLVRELRRESDPKTYPLTVDPHFELYTGIEEGKPKSVPLEVRLYAETPAFRSYIDRENGIYRELFTPVVKSNQSGHSDILIGVPAPDYGDFRDFCYLQRDTRLEHTLVFQVDEFWALRQPEARRTGAFRPQWSYLNTVTTKDNEDPDLAIDPFRVFQKTRKQHPDDTQRFTHKKRKRKIDDERRRAYFSFPTRGYELEVKEKEEQGLVDRVPFIWDFGFLMCRQRVWEDFPDVRFPIWRPYPNDRNNRLVKKYIEVKGVWNALPKPKMGYKSDSKDKPKAEDKSGRFADVRVYETNEADSKSKQEKVLLSWRNFLGACQAVARAQTARTSAPVKIFDVRVVAPQTFACLVLEIWASEIFKSLKKKEQRDFITQMAKRHWKLEGNRGLIDWLHPKTGYRLELFKTRLLLVEALDLDEFADAVRVSNLKTKQADPSAIAARYWYKTACEFSQSFSPMDTVIPVGLPGHFSVRGDWFLAVAGGSRSERLADRALDLLSSHRSNVARLEQGLGLPTRGIVSAGKPQNLYFQQHTNLYGPGPNGRKKKVIYGDLLSIGATNAPSEDFYWFWRSGLKNYHRHAKIWQNWLNSLILWSHMVHYRYRDEWMSGFERYDRVSANPNKELKELGTWETFNRMCDSLLDDLRLATPFE